jgi:hypothetical protein
MNDARVEETRRVPARNIVKPLSPDRDLERKKVCPSRLDSRKEDTCNRTKAAPFSRVCAQENDYTSQEICVFVDDRRRSVIVHQRGIV